MLDFTGSFIGFPQFLAFFAMGLALMAAFMWIYTAITPHDEVALVRANNVTAAVVWTGALIGFVLPLSSAMRESFAIREFVVWGVIAGIAQLAVFFVYRRIYPKMRERIEADEMATGIKLAGVAIAVGILNAAAVSEDEAAWMLERYPGAFGPAPTEQAQ
ncbi:MAG: DUF350 domain-containing protein [Rhodothalassiaceae bacterium]